ncbi:hypothetical protein RvY_04981-2 [Ramazzottius varieornatus]|uniref:Protein kinase domain-containing protein n=1 Tax=Ramazzottius varieornatus TaxID=947166 RepID=A0A1D1UZ71_RAMVA|nr:hypothetical protein RvY_04981-2 [Ramazzottius varieornatus]
MFDSSCPTSEEGEERAVESDQYAYNNLVNGGNSLHDSSSIKAARTQLKNTELNLSLSVPRPNDGRLDTLKLDSLHFHDASTDATQPSTPILIQRTLRNVISIPLDIRNGEGTKNVMFSEEPEVIQGASDIEVSSSQSPRGGVRFLDITLDDLVRDKDAHVGVENGHRTDTEEDINRLVENLQSLTRNVQDYDEEQEGSEVDEKVIDSSPTGRFVKLNVEIGRGSFKTVYKGRDSETGATVAWCELTVRRIYVEYSI